MAAAWKYALQNVFCPEYPWKNIQITILIPKPASIAVPALPNAHMKPFTWKMDIDGVTHTLKHTRVLDEGEVVDLTPAVQVNEDYFTAGPGYDALD